MKEARVSSKTILSSIALFSVLTIMAINFQNCSGLSSADYGSEQDTNSQGESGIIDTIPRVGGDIGTGTGVEPEGLTAVFTQGQAFIGQDLVSAGSFLDTLIDRVGYTTYSSGKAIAVAANGLGYSALTDGSNAEAERMAVESCNLLTGDSCALIVSGNTFVISKTAFASSLEYLLDGYNGKTFAMSEIPLASASKRDTATVRNFINAPGNRALALSITGGLYSAYTTTYTLSESDVSRMAVQRCELESAITPCVLYAVNTSVVFNPKSWAKNSSINFSNNDVLAMPPPASRASSLNSIEKLLNEVQREKYAIYITPNGYGYFGRHASDVETARNSALGSCNAGVHASRCIPYASSTGVAISPDHTTAKMNFPEIFCKGVRYSCAAHLEMGCSSGAQYWVQNPSTMRAELSSCGGS